MKDKAQSSYRQVTTALGDYLPDNGQRETYFNFKRHLENGVVPSEVPARCPQAKQNVFDFSLDDTDMLDIARLSNNRRVGTHPDEMNVGAPADDE